ncbi:MAG: hypothetical protein RL064_1190 [Bacteroidota bacterium]|jgi:uncharacterized membrane protein
MLNQSIKKGLLIIAIVFYIFAGYNHFANPSFYLPLIPPYLSLWANELNLLSGIIEIVLGLLLIPKKTRQYAAWAIVLMLIAFIPSHIYFIQKGTFTLGSITINPTISWIRLLVVHPLLIIWAWQISKK